MRKSSLVYRIACLFVIAGLLAGCGARQQDLPPGAPVRVLFVGNSYTFQNDLPGMLARLLRSGGYEAGVEMSAVGGWTLADHAASEQTLEMIGSQTWDYVVLQEQSVIPALPEERAELMVPAVGALDEQIRRAGAEPVLLMTWGRRDGLATAGFPDFAAMQAQLATGYREVGEVVGATVAPAGLAWQQALAEYAALALWAGDGSHPAEAGSYLAACVLYAVIVQRSPEGLAYRAGLAEKEAIVVLQTRCGCVRYTQPSQTPNRIRSVRS